MASDTPMRFDVFVSEDRMQAWFKPGEHLRPDILTTEWLVSALAQQRLRTTPVLRQRCAAFVEMVRIGAKLPERFLVSEGVPPVQGRDAVFVPSVGRSGDEPAVDFHTFNSSLSVEAGEVIGTLEREVAAKAGADVYGKVLEPHSESGRGLALGPGVLTAEGDQTTLLAAVSGRVRLEGGELSIDEVFAVKGDVDYAICNIDSTVEVQIAGSVLEGFEVRSDGPIKIAGVVNGATVEGADSVFVGRGVLGRGRVSAGRNIVVKFAEEAILRAGGDIELSRALLNSDVVAHGQFVASSGSVIGGQVYAREGAEIGQLGSAAGVRTEITVGLDPKEEAELHPADVWPGGEEPGLALAVDDLCRPAVEPAEAGTARDEPLGSGPTIDVRSRVYSGVVARVGRWTTVFTDDLKGPLRIEVQRVEGVVSLVAVHEVSGTLTMLPSFHPIDLHSASLQRSSIMRSARHSTDRLAGR